MEARWASPKSLREDRNVTEKSAPIKGGFDVSEESGPIGGYGSAAWVDHAVRGSSTRRDGQSVAIAECLSHRRNIQIGDATRLEVVGVGFRREGGPGRQHLCLSSLRGKLVHGPQRRAADRRVQPAGQALKEYGGGHDRMAPWHRRDARSEHVADRCCGAEWRRQE